MAKPQRPLVWAHRGASQIRPENTLAAFRAALEAGADGVELDVHPSADDYVVPLSHTCSHANAQYDISMFFLLKSLRI